MRIDIWILTLAITLWPSAYHGLPENMAYAADVTTSSASGSGTATGTNTGTGAGTGTATKACTDNRTTYKGHSDSNCYAYDTSNSQDNQRNTQNNNKDMNDQSSQQSSMMGMMAIMAGMAMMAAGAAMMASPPTAAAGAALMAAGAMLLAAGMAAMAAAKEMKQNANASGVNGMNLDNISSSISGDPTKNLGASKGGKVSGTSMSIDPSVVAAGNKTDALVDDFENKTGISRGELVDGLNNGKSPIDMLAASSTMQKAGYGADKIGGMVNDAASSGNLPSGEELLNQVGMSAEDIAAMAARNASMGADGPLVAGGSGGASRTPAAASPDYSYQGATKDAVGGSTGFGSGSSFAAGGSGHLSAGVQSALDRSGVTNRSLFQMVKEQYKKKMPMMFGAQERKAASHSDNPFADLSKDKVDL
ncbi:MAG: hypothetical protein EOP11_14910 [Proteobacteria bacterium]|nr:MAG: hypothetical protein EOP11_14910 [Pseudomonadota bacterium]